MTRPLVLLATLLAVLVVGCGGSDTGPGASPTPIAGDGTATATPSRTPSATATATPSASATPSATADADSVVGDMGDFDPAAIYERDAQGVVTIISVFDATGLDALLQGDEDGGGGAGIGTGVVLNGDGEIVTNAHVVTQGEAPRIRKAQQVFVQFGDGNRVEATLRGYDPYADVALLKVDPSGLDLDPLPLGDSDAVRVGTPVAAMGSPFGEEQSLSVGVVSAVDRDIQGLTSFAIGNAIQTDAAINPGNSGGPLVNPEGEVIGLNQQIKTNSGGGEGVGFALPSNLAKRSVDQLREKGRVDYAYLGVSSTTVYPQLAERFRLGTDSGAWLQEVTRGGPGQRAGLRGGGRDQVRFQAASFAPGGDVVVQVGDTRVEDSSDLADAIDPYEPGERVPITFFRDGRRQTGTVTVGTRPLAPPSGG